ncbi:hypothetical protein [Gracilibacillus sp. YIM 98692]|uniref:hypothetical protein n=1 Tax=Gracilibacillus sp. YIM 98692 TaxID=2663532 RepID=UPI0013D26F59|nr:hypothetical protein [Gracilibacillus sp. YIM 98692]
MKWLGQIEGLIFALAVFVVEVSIVLVLIYIIFTKEGRSFFRAKLRKQQIQKGEYNSKLKKAAFYLVAVIFPILFVLGLIAHFLNS